MILGYVLFALALLAFYHFIAEGIVAPSHRMLHRIEMQRHALELDCVHEQCPADFPDDAYQVLRRRVCTFISNMPHFTLVAVMNMIAALHSDLELRKRCEERQALVQSVQLKAVKDIDQRMTRLASATMTWNSVGWIVWIVPVVIGVAMYRQVQKAIRGLLSVPARQLEQLDGRPASGSRFGTP